MSWFQHKIPFLPFEIFPQINQELFSLNKNISSLFVSTNYLRNVLVCFFPLLLYLPLNANNAHSACPSCLHDHKGKEKHTHSKGDNHDPRTKKDNSRDNSHNFKTVEGKKKRQCILFSITWYCLICLEILKHCLNKVEMVTKLPVNLKSYVYIEW